MPCHNLNLDREIKKLRKCAKSQGLWRIGRKKNTRPKEQKKHNFSLKDTIWSLHGEMPGKNVYKKLITDATSGDSEGYYTRELFRLMKDVGCPELDSWHCMFDGYSAEDPVKRQAFFHFLQTNEIMKRVLA
jgi:hypothetical protein